MKKNLSKCSLYKNKELRKILLVMKNSLLIFLIAIVQVSASVSIHGQNLTLMAEGNTVREVFKQIENETNYRFFYNDEFRDLSKQLSFEMRDYEIDEVLDMMLANSDVTYRMLENDVIVITPKEITAQQGTITGTVTDQDGVTLPGVSVVVQGTSIGTVTDIDGNYTLYNVEDFHTLIFSYVGMLTRHIDVGDRTTINLAMETEAVGLDEVVVVGYGTQIRANLTGAVSSATAEKIENRPIASLGQGLQGVIPNLNVSMSDGDPMTRANFNIRGFESITGGSPLILVDGVPMSPHLINPNDVESVTVLKDAGAAAIYGARAAFGVVLIETKKGREGLNVSFNSETGRAYPILSTDRVQDSYRLATALNEVSMEARGRPHFSPTVTEGYRRYSENPTLENEWGVMDGDLIFYGNTDFVGYMIADYSPQTNNDLAISGSTDRTTFYASFGHMNKKGYFRRNNLNYNRSNILMKADFDVIDWLNLDSRISYNVEKNDVPHQYSGDGGPSGIRTISRMEPHRMLKFPDLPHYLEPGDREDFEQYIGMYFDNWSVVYNDGGGRSLSDTYDAWLTQGATITPFEGLSIRSEFSYNIFNRHQEWQHTRVPFVQSTTDIGSDGSRSSLRDIGIGYGHSANDYMQNRSTNNMYYVFNTYAQYTLDQFDDHHISVTGGFNQELGRNQWIQARANTLSVPTIRDLRATTGDQFTDGRKSHVALRGAFYRFNYRYQDKYLFESNGRYDLTSRFPQETRGGFFPSFSVGWRISSEGFMEATRGWLDNLMVRASYGSLGNQMVSTYAYIPSMSMGQRAMVFDSGPIPYAGPAGLVSATLTWETVITRNLGLNMTLLDNRLEIMLDAYSRQTTDMLMRQSYPALLGTAAPESNAADLETRGWEANVIFRNRISQDWGYVINLSLADNQTEITRYENPTGNINDYYVGQKIGEIWGFETVGIFQTDEEVANAPSQAALGSGWRAGDIQYADLNNDGVINYGRNTLDDPGDRRIIGNSSPRYMFGINTDITFRNWTMNVFFQGLFRDLYPPTGSYGDFWPWQADIVENWWITESWSEDNPDAFWPAPRYHRYEGGGRNFITQTRFLYNAAYIRLKNLTINYNLPHSLIGRVGLSRASVYLSGMNLFEFTGLPDTIDPENIYTHHHEYFRQRIITTGVRVSF